MALVTGNHTTGKMRFVADLRTQSFAHSGQLMAIEPALKFQPRVGSGRKTGMGRELALAPQALTAATV